MGPMHECKYEELMGSVKEFMANTKGFRMTLGTLAVAMMIQVGTFLYLWGNLTQVVSKNTDYLWNDMTPTVRSHEKTLDRIMAKLDIMTDAHGAIR